MKDAGIHLNGHNLTVSGFAGAGSIYSSALPAEYAELEYVETDGRDIHNGDKLVAWDALPEVTPKFIMLRSGERANGWTLCAKEDGLYVINSGSMIFVR